MPCSDMLAVAGCIGGQHVHGQFCSSPLSWEAQIGLLGNDVCPQNAWRQALEQ